MTTLHLAEGPLEHAGAPALALVRKRVVIALATMFVVEVILSSPLVGGLVGVAPAADLGLAALTIMTQAVVLPLLMVLLARRILEPAEQLDEARDHFRELYDRARLAAVVDPLTGLGNHRAFQEELSRQVDEAQRYGRTLSLLLLDLDDLKRVNDERGHAGGDEVLAATGRLIGTTIRHADRAFRIGGDEFAILMPYTDLSAAHVLGRRLLAGALERGSDSGRPADFSFSAGVSAFPDPSPDGPRLFRQADAALYWSKRHGRTDVQVFDPARHGAAGDPRTTPELEAAVADVARRMALRPVYQPIFSLVTGRPIGFEGLVRPDAESSFRDAESLFTAAEVTGRTVELDMACLEAVAAGVGEIGDGPYLSFNISPRTLETDQFKAVDLVVLFRRHGIEPRRVVLELTERETVGDIGRLRENVAACRAAGFRLAADDVGAGNAGLRLLSQIRFDIVKIDLSLVQVGVLAESSKAVLQALRELADRWHATVVAEGVETPGQLEVVRGLGISAAQGYLLGRPGERPVADAVDLDGIIEKDRWRREAIVAMSA